MVKNTQMDSLPGQEKCATYIACNTIPAQFTWTFLSVY